MEIHVTILTPRILRYMIYLSTATGLTPGGSSTVHIYTKTIHRTIQITTEQHKKQLILKSAGRLLDFWKICALLLSCTIVSQGYILVPQNRNIRSC